MILKMTIYVVLLLKTILFIITFIMTISFLLSVTFSYRGIFYTIYYDLVFWKSLVFMREYFEFKQKRIQIKIKLNI